MNEPIPEHLQTMYEEIVQARDELCPGTSLPVAYALMTLVSELGNKNPPNCLSYHWHDSENGKHVEIEVRRGDGKPLSKMVDELHQAQEMIVTACHDLIDYRKRSGALNFQIEKADVYLRLIEAEIAAAREGE